LRRANPMIYDDDFKARFYFDFKPALEARLRYKLRDHAAIEDIISESFRRVFEALDKDEIRNLGAFTRKVCDYVLSEYLRKRQRAVEWPENFDPPDRGSGIEQLIQNQELVTMLLAAMKILSPRQRELIREVYAGERNRKELAKERGLTVSGLNVKLFMALKKLRTEFFRLL